MKKLIAKRSVLYQNRMYNPGEALPAADGRMTEAWLRAGSAVWQEDIPPAPDKPAEQEPMLTGHLDPDSLSEMTKAQLAELAEEMGLDVADAKTKAELVAAIAAVEVQAPAEDKTEDTPNDKGAQ